MHIDIWVECKTTHKTRDDTKLNINYSWHTLEPPVRHYIINIQHIQKREASIAAHFEDYLVCFNLLNKQSVLYIHGVHWLVLHLSHVSYICKIRFRAPEHYTTTQDT